jgi:hypothetical protein
VTTSRTILLALLLSALAPAAALSADSRYADVPLPPPPPGTVLRSGTSPTYRIAVLAGFLSEGSDSSPSLQVDLAREATPAAWTRARLEWHLPIRGGRLQWHGVLTQTVALPTYPPSSYQKPVGTTDDAIWLFEAVPSARLVVPVAPGFALHAEAGIGLSLTSETHAEEQVFVGHTSTRKLVLAPAIRFAVGLTYRIGDRLDVVMQPLALARRSSGDGATFSALWGLSYRL